MNVDILIDAIGKIRPEYVEEAEKEILSKRRSVLRLRKTAFAAGAAIVLLFGISVRLQLENHSSSDNNSVAPPYEKSAEMKEDITNGISNGTVAPESATEEMADASIAVNEWDGVVPIERQMEDSWVVRSAALAELETYYGVKLFPEQIPAGLSYQASCEEAFCFCYTGDGELVSDENMLAFEEESGNRKLLLLFSKLSWKEVSLLMETGEFELSIINGCRTLIFYYEDETGEGKYLAEFEKEGVAYKILGINLTEEEITAVLRGLVG